MKTTISIDNDFRALTHQEIKDWCRIDADDDDALLSGLIVTATQAAESFTNRSIIPATIELSMCGGRRVYQLPPLREIVSVEIEDGQRSPLTDYHLRSADVGPTLIAASVVSPFVSLIVTAEVGYETASSIPQTIRQAIAIHAASAYAGREGQDTAQAAFEALLRPFQTGGL